MKREEAIKTVKNNWPEGRLMLQEALQTLIPELNESEDERIRKELIEHIKANCESDFILFQKFSPDEVIAWLEKQGGQKPTLPKWKYKKDHTPLLRDSIILNKYGCIAKSPSGAIVSDAWVLDYDELAKLPKEELEKQGTQESTDKIEPKFHVGDGITTSIEEPKNNSKFRDGDIVTIVKPNNGWTDYLIGIIIGPYIYGSDLSKISIDKALCFEIRYAKEHEKHQFLREWQDSKELPYTDEEAREFADKVSHEWWQVAMDKWNTLTEDEKKKYNQYMGFNDFSDQLMNILISVLLGLKRNGKLVYEEGSLFSEPEQKPTTIELGETPIPCYEPKYFSCNGNCGYCLYKTDTGCSRIMEYDKRGASPFWTNNQ